MSPTQTSEGAAVFHPLLHLLSPVFSLALVPLKLRCQETVWEVPMFTTAHKCEHMCVCVHVRPCVSAFVCVCLCLFVGDVPCPNLKLTDVGTFTPPDCGVLIPSSLSLSWRGSGWGLWRLPRLWPAFRAKKSLFPRNGETNKQTHTHTHTHTQKQLSCLTTPHIFPRLQSLSPTHKHTLSLFFSVASFPGGVGVCLVLCVLKVC